MADKRNTPGKGWDEALRRIEEARLSGAEKLDLASLGLKSVPDSIVKLTTPRILFLNGNKLDAIPDCVAELTELRTIFLSNNSIATIPDWLPRLSELDFLDLGWNGITAIPDSLARIASLNSLFLEYNQIRKLPASLLQLELGLLLLHGNPELGIPSEILGPVRGSKGPYPNPKDILAYYFANRDDSRPLNEAKLILVGQGGVGKTSLVNALIADKFDPNEPTTEGIKITDWACPLEKKNVTLHIWDFGGQEMMHATHQFFLTARSLYFLVLNRRNGGCDREADYWFRLIRAFGGKDAPVLVVLNKHAKEPFDVNRGSWLEKYAGNIRGFAETDCTDLESIAGLKRKIQQQLGEMKDVQAGFPRRWFAIKDELAHMGTDYVTFGAYREICQKHGEPDPENQTMLAGFLHDLGIALNYRDDPRLRFGYVLKPEWVTGGIYALLHAFVAAHGFFARDEAERLLAVKGYAPEAAHFLMGLMDQFELSFPLNDVRNRSLIPQLLPDQQPEAAREFDVAACLNFGYQYPILTEGLLPRFVVRTHHLSDPNTRWKSGVILFHPESGCRALVRTDAAENQVRIHIEGPEARRFELLAIVRHNFDAIHRDYEFQPVELVYPPGVPERPLPVQDLKDIQHSGGETFPVVLPDRSVRMLRIAELVEPAKAAPPPLGLFLSYARADTKALDELRKNLKVMERNGLLRAWHDRELTAGEKWEPRILQELNEADVIVCQLSQDFLASDYCMRVELDTALRRRESGEVELLVYVFKPCLWKETPFREFQLLHDAKPIGSNKEKFWLEVSEEIQGVLKALQKQRAAHTRRSA